jgi:hypothetical protein
VIGLPFYSKRIHQLGVAFYDVRGAAVLIVYGVPALWLVRWIADERGSNLPKITRVYWATFASPGPKIHPIQWAAFNGSS